MNIKQKVTLLLVCDTSLFVVLLYLLYQGMWFEALIPFLLSLGINFWYFDSYKEYFDTYEEYFSRKEK
ncbi:MAG: hypothetical protein ACJZ0Y_01250 [Cytophagales bacterium]